MGACPNEAGASGPQLLTDWCCTGQCEIIAYGNAAYNYRWIDGNNPLTGGIRWTAYGDAPDNGDDFTCPIDPNTGYPRARTLYVNMYCNQGGKRTDALQINQFYDSGDCVYRVSMTHFAACGVVGDPFEYNQDPGVNFGFTVLGGVLAVFFYYLYHFGEDRGWWEPIRSRLPTCTVCGKTCNGKGVRFELGAAARDVLPLTDSLPRAFTFFSQGVYGGSGGYKATPTQSNTVPIASASAYGST